MRRALTLTLALLLLLPAGASAGLTTQDPAYSVVKEENVYIPMTDGTRLAADVYRPEGQAGQRFPCLFEMTPYRKEMRAAEAADFFPARGFVYIEVDARGTGGSEGEYDGVFTAAEQNDGYDAIEWFATQYPHCNGRVGMWGGSYSGINQYLIAASPKGKPPHLVTIAPQRALTDLYRDAVYNGGIVTGSFGLIWAGGTTGYNAVGADPRTSPDPMIAARAFVDHLGNDPMFLTYLNAPFDSPFYRASSVIDRLAQLDLPILHLEGWYDAFTRGQLQGIGRLLELERRKKIKGPNYAVVGPWNHGGSHFLDHEPWDQRILDWYRVWLDGMPKPAWFREPRISWCLMLEQLDGPCEWRKSSEWPPKNTAYAPHYLHDDGSLQARATSDERRVGEWTYNPLAGTGEAGFSKWDNAAGPPQRSSADQAQEDEWKGLTFTTPVLEKDLDIHGPITLSLRAAVKPLPGSDNSVALDGLAAALGQPGAAQAFPPYLDTDFVVKLSDVAPGGKASLIQTGFLRASHRLLDDRRTRRSKGRVTEPFHWHDREHLAPPEDGQVHRYEIELYPTAKRFAKGHRLRIALYSTDTPNHLTILKPVQNTVFGGSYLLLPEEKPVTTVKKKGKKKRAKKRSSHRSRGRAHRRRSR